MMKQIYHTVQKKRGGSLPGRKPHYKKAKIEDNGTGRGDYTTMIDNENGANPGRIEVSRRKIINQIINRIVFSYSTSDIFNEFFRCICCRKFKTKHERNLYRQQYLYYKAKKKIESNFDALSLMRFMQ